MSVFHTEPQRHRESRREMRKNLLCENSVPLWLCVKHQIGKTARRQDKTHGRSPSNKNPHILASLNL